MNREWKPNMPRFEALLMAVSKKMMKYHASIASNVELSYHKNQEYVHLYDPWEVICLCRYQREIIQLIMDAYSLYHGEDLYYVSISINDKRRRSNIKENKEGFEQFLDSYSGYIMTVQENLEEYAGHDFSVISISGHTPRMFQSLRGGFPPSLYKISTTILKESLKHIWNTKSVVRIYPIDERRLVGVLGYINNIKNIAYPDYPPNKYDDPWRKPLEEEVFKLLDTVETYKAVGSEQDAEQRVVLPEEVLNRYLVDRNGGKISLAHLKTGN